MYKSSGSAAAVFELIDRQPVGNNEGSHVVTPFPRRGGAPRRAFLLPRETRKGGVERGGAEGRAGRVRRPGRRQRQREVHRVPPCSNTFTSRRWASWRSTAWTSACSRTRGCTG
jgi:hypothetical protein